MFTKIIVFAKRRNLHKYLLNIDQKRNFQQKNKNPYYDPNFETSIHGSNPSGKIGGRSLVTMAKGVGIGPELMLILKDVFACVNAPVMFEELDIDEEDPEMAEADMENLALSIRRNGVAVKGNLEKDQKSLIISKNISLNLKLDLFAHLIDFRSFPGVKHKKSTDREINVSIVRQNTEGAFAMVEHEIGKRAVEHLNLTTRFNTERLARFAFKHAVQNCKERVVVVYNKGYHEEAEGLFLNSCQTVAEEYPDVKYKMQSIGSFLRTIMIGDYRNNVIVASSVGGQMISSVLCGFIGCAALVCGCSYGEKYAVFEPASRQRGMKLVGQNTVNPAGILLTGVSLLRHLGHDEHATVLQEAVEETINCDQVLTRDIGGTASTCDMMDTVKKHLKTKVAMGMCEEQ